MQRVIAARRQLAVDRDQVLHPTHLHRQDDAVVIQADGLGLACAVERGANHRFVHHRRRRFWRRQAGVLVHQSPRQFLIQTAPVDPNAHRLVIPTGDFNNRGELLIPLPAPSNVAGIDAVFGQRLGAGGMLAQQAVTVEMKVADQRRGHALRRQPVADHRHSSSSGLGIDRNPHQFRTRLRQFRHLSGRGVRIGGVRIGHGLHHDGRTAAHGDGADADGDAGTTRNRGRMAGHGVM